MPKRIVPKAKIYSITDSLFRNDDEPLSSTDTESDLIGKEQLSAITEEMMKALSSAVDVCRTQLAEINSETHPDLSTFPTKYARMLYKAYFHLGEYLNDYTSYIDANRGRVREDFWKHYSGNRSKICIDVQKQHVLIRMPYLPRKNHFGDPVIKQLSATVRDLQELPHWQNWEAVFYHIYPTNCRRIPKDVDNYEYKEVIDILAYEMRTNDSPCCFDMAIKTIFTDCLIPGTYLQIKQKCSEITDFTIFNSCQK